MKHLIVPTVIIIGLVVVFVIVDSKEFNHFDDAQTVQKERTATNRRQIYLRSRNKNHYRDEACHTSIKPSGEAKQGETKMEETKSFSKQESPVPVAVPVASAEEVEKLNIQAAAYLAKQAKRIEFIEKDMKLVYEDLFNNYSTVSIAEKLDDIFLKNGVIPNRDELSTKKVPVQWMIDFYTLKGECDFERVDDGYRIISPGGFFHIQAPSQKVLNTITGIQFEISCNSAETKIKAGVEEYGMFRPGKSYASEMSGIHEDEIINYQISSLEHFDQFRAFLEISGDVTLHAFRVFQKEIEGTTYLEGQIVERSSLPDPSESDYPDCRFTAYFKGNAIKAGEQCPKEMAFIIEGFENYKTLNTESIKKGDKIECVVMPFERLSVEDQDTQQADDLNLYLLDSYYVLSACKRNSFSENEFLPTSGIFFSGKNGEYVSIFEKHINQPIPQEIHDLQQIAIKRNLEIMTNLLKQYDNNSINKTNSDFSKAWENEKEKDPPNYNRIGKNVWREIDNSFWCLPDNYTLLTEPDLLSQETLNCFASLNKACEKNGVQLIVSFVPNPYVISSRVINKTFRDVPDLQTATYVKQLSEIGIEAIYPSGSIIQNYKKYPLAFKYPIADGHPFDTVQDCISDLLMERLKRFDLRPVLDPALVSEQFLPSSLSFPSYCDIGNHQAGEAFTCKQHFYGDKMLGRNPDGQIIVVGNSLVNTPSISGYTLAVYLSSKTLLPVESYSISYLGPFSDFMIQLLSRPDFFLSKRKALIFQVGTDNLIQVNRNQLMLDLAKCDQERLVLNSKTIVARFSLKSNINHSEQINKDYWESIDAKSLFMIEEDRKKLFRISFDQQPNNQIDLEKPLVCVIPCVTEETKTCEIEVNGCSHPIFQSRGAAKYFNLVFELPANTKELTVQVSGNIGTLFAIKNIQIWQ